MCRPPMRGYVSSSLMTLTSLSLSFSLALPRLPFSFFLSLRASSLSVLTRRNTDWTALGEHSTLTLARQWRSTVDHSYLFWMDGSERARS